MEASQQFKRSAMSDSLYYQPVKKEEASYFPPFQMLDSQLSSINRSQGDNYPIQTFSDWYCKLDFSSPTGRYAVHNSASAVSFTPNGSSISYQESQSCLSAGHSPDTSYNSPISRSCITDDVNELRYKLKELEATMLGPDSDILESCENSLPSCMNSPEVKCWRQMEAMPRGDLKYVFIACAKAESDGDLLTAHWLISELRQMVSVSGEPIQRLGAYILEGLVARLAASGSSIYKSLRCKEPASFELLSYMHILHEVCPYFKFGSMSANGAIAEAVKDEQKVHIIDFQISQGSQWVTLIQAFAARPGGPPHIRITGIDDSTSAYARGGGLNIVGQRLSKLAESFKVPFEFHSAAISSSVVQLENLGIRPDEALAVNFAFVLHHMPDESVEQHCLARDIVNIIACEGVERVERHELLGKWKSRFRMARFSPYMLSSLVNATIKNLLQNYCDKYRLEERDGSLYLGWMN